MNSTKQKTIVCLYAILIAGFIWPGLTRISPSTLGNQSARAADFDQNNIISDDAFVNIGSMSTADIQSFLTGKGGFLASYSEGGRTAAQIIYDAAHGHGDATATINGIAIDTNTGTVSPRVILATLQKEQSLINMPVQNNNSLNAAMGFACPDGGGCNPNYAGFTKQVENGAWQLRYNYERASGHGFSDYQVNQTMSIDNTNVTFANRATASLYRYTPHISGNNSFWTLYNQYFPSYVHTYVSQNAYPSLAPGDSYNFVLTVKNSGSITWTSDIVHLATDRGRDRIPEFAREGGTPSGWIAPNRVIMQESSVAPGATATFSFWMKNPGLAPGTYRQYFRLVADGVQWMEDYGIYWDVKSITTADKYHESFVSQNAYPTLGPNDAYNFTLTVQNTGTATWQRGVVNLATDRNRDRITQFVREGGSPSGWIGPNRITMQESSVAPGATATYSFWMKNPSLTPGTYREYFRLVADNIGWMEDNGIYWDVKVTSNLDRYHEAFISQNAYPTLSKGQAYNFVVKVINTGSATWQQGVVNLGTSRPLDRVPIFTREGGSPSGWISSNRVIMQESSVPPGGTATFSFWMRNDGVSSGTHREYFRVVADNIGWMEDNGIYWDVSSP